MELQKNLLNEMIQIADKIRFNRFTELENEGKLSIMTEDAIKGELLQYGGKITDAKADDYLQTLLIYKYEGENVYGVEMNLWIDGEGSDLTLMCDVYLDERNEVVSSKITDLHVR